MTEAGNKSEGEYFAGVFGQPELTRRASWDGQKESLEMDSRITWRKEQARQVASELRQRPLNDTLDINHEVVA